MFDNMNEGKLKRVVKGIAVAGTILIVFLLGVILYQIISMGTKLALQESLKQQIEQYEEEVSNLEDLLDVYESDKEKEDIARQHGYVYPDDVTFNP